MSSNNEERQGSREVRDPALQRIIDEGYKLAAQLPQSEPTQQLLPEPVAEEEAPRLQLIPTRAELDTSSINRQKRRNPMKMEVPSWLQIGGLLALLVAFVTSLVDIQPNRLEGMRINEKAAQSNTAWLMETEKTKQAEIALKQARLAARYPQQAQPVAPQPPVDEDTASSQVTETVNEQVYQCDTYERKKLLLERGRANLLQEGIRHSFSGGGCAIFRVNTPIQLTGSGFLLHTREDTGTTCRGSACQAFVNARLRQEIVMVTSEVGGHMEITN